jgi:hypothetical protein
VLRPPPLEQIPRGNPFNASDDVPGFGEDPDVAVVLGYFPLDKIPRDNPFDSSDDVPGFGEDPDVAVVLGHLPLELGHAGVEASVFGQDRRDQESNLQTIHKVTILNKKAKNTINFEEKLRTK